jgi:uncharacterized protein YjiS (DUF1127 family)
MGPVSFLKIVAPCLTKYLLSRRAAGEGLAHCLSEITIAIEHRQELTLLANHDDRMLADIGLSRSDLYEARSTPFWVDPTAILQRRVRHRR